MEKSYKYSIYPNKKQKQQLVKMFGCSRFVCNHYLAKHIEKYESDKPAYNYYNCANDLKHLKEEYDWLKENDSTALQSSLRDLDTPYQKFFGKIQDILNSNLLKHIHFLTIHKLALSIADVSWSKFVRELKYKAIWYGKQVQKIDKIYASSQTCHICGFVIRTLKISELEGGIVLASKLILIGI